MPKDIAVILNNGSLNSAVTTALAAQRCRPVLLHVETAVPPGSRTRAAYEQQVAHFKPYREHTLAMPFLALPGGPSPAGAASAGTASAGTASTDPRYPSVRTSQLIELLSLIAPAVRYAIQYQASGIYLGLRIGGNADELALATEYIQIWNEMLNLPCGQPEMEVVAPLLELEPWQVVDVGLQAGVPFEKTWSCQEQSGDPCWTCHGCRIREAAFQKAAKPDPLRPKKR